MVFPPLQICETWWNLTQAFRTYSVCPYRLRSSNSTAICTSYDFLPLLPLNLQPLS